MKDKNRFFCSRGIIKRLQTGNLKWGYIAKLTIKYFRHNIFNEVAQLGPGIQK